MSRSRVLAGAICLLAGALGHAARVHADACCLKNGACSDGCGLLCELLSGTCIEGVDCFEDPCSVQACCFGTECQMLDFLTCLSKGGVRAGAGSTCGDNPCGPPVEACCLLDDTCIDAVPSYCSDLGGQSQGPGSDCAAVPCKPVEACCFDNGDCLDIFVSTCIELGGETQGPGSFCVADLCEVPCPSGKVALAFPPDGVVDARQPHPVDNAGLLRGIETLEVQAPAGAGPECWTLCETADGGLGANGFKETVDHGDGTYTVALLRPITPGAVTTLSYDGAVAGRLISHPANVNADGGAGPLDIIALIDCLNEVNPETNCPWGNYSLDVDHSGQPGPADILAVIDLLNGAGAFEPWSGTALPVGAGCP